MTVGSARSWAWGVVAAVAVSQCAWVGLLWSQRGRLPSHVRDDIAIHTEAAVLVTMIAVVGAAILTRHPRHRIGWLMLGAAASVILDAAARGYAVTGLYLDPGGLPAPEYAAWWAEWNWFPAFMVLLVFVPLYFPDGRTPGPRWRLVPRVLVVWLVLASVGYALTPGDPVDFPDVTNPLAFPPAIVLAVLMLGSPLAVAIGLGAIVTRRRRAVGVEREQLRWVFYAFAVAAVCWLASTIMGSLLGAGWGLTGAVLTHGPIFLIVAAIGVAILRFRLYDIDVVINRTLVFGGLTALALTGYTAVVLAVSQATQQTVEWRGSLLVVALIAIGAYPLREWLQKAVNRYMYGDRDDPARVMSQVSRRVSDPASPTGLLPALAETIGRALRLPYVAIALPGQLAAATYGSPRPDLESFDLVHQGAPVGSLLVGRRGHHEQLSTADRAVLTDLSHQVAAAAHAVGLARDLQRSRERLVLAREEERRRLRRDLHDGIGSALAGLTLHAGNARTALPDSPEEAERWLASLEGGIAEVISDVRRIIEDLRPPALDDLGLMGSLRQQARAIYPGARIEGGLDGVRLPAAVEVAAYRIATEALANVARHTDATDVVVTLSLGTPAALHLCVADNGPGLAAGEHIGVGLASMRERAAELGGTCTVDAGAGHGTVVRAALPLDHSREADDE